MVTSIYKKITDPAEFGRVAVLMGGFSAEREVSLLSGNAVLSALRGRGVDAHPVDVDTDVINVLTSGNFDRAFNALHGRGGEDGTIQGMLEKMDLPYTGSGVAASALSMDKLRTKQLLRGAGLPTPDWWELNSESRCSELVGELSYPLITKPALEGSSIGMTKVKDSNELLPAWRAAAVSGDIVLAERWVTGSEFTVAILQDSALPVIRILTDNSFYDYEAKYFSDDTQYLCPAGITPEQEQSYSELAMQVWRCVGASGWGRVDLMVDEATDAPLVLEVNTVPGMTSHSLVPMAAAQAEIDMGGLTWRILETSFVARVSGGNTAPAIGKQEDGNAK
jgi:D-alanine-D-alanine ligase